MPREILRPVQLTITLQSFNEAVGIANARFARLNFFSDDGHREHPLVLYAFKNVIELKNIGQPWSNFSAKCSINHTNSGTCQRVHDGCGLRPNFTVAPGLPFGGVGSSGCKRRTTYPPEIKCPHRKIHLRLIHPLTSV